MPLFSFPVADIDSAGKPFGGPLPAGWLAAQLADTDVAPAGPAQGEADSPARRVGTVTGRLSRSLGADVVVRGRVEASVSLPCARCLQPVLVPVEAELSLLLQPARARPAPQTTAAPKGAAAAAKSGASAKGATKETGGSKVAEPSRRGGKPRGSASHDDDEGRELSDDEASLDTYEGDDVVLDEFVREAILLEMPYFPLCSEACPGMAPPLPGDGAEAVPGAPAARGLRSPGTPGKPALDPRLAPLARIRANLPADELGGEIASEVPVSPASSASGERTTRPKPPRLSRSGLVPKSKKKR
jgi:uncharacterized protein